MKVKMCAHKDTWQFSDIASSLDVIKSTSNVSRNLTNRLYCLCPCELLTIPIKCKIKSMNIVSTSLQNFKRRRFKFVVERCLMEIFLPLRECGQINLLDKLRTLTVAQLSASRLLYRTLLY